MPFKSHRQFKFLMARHPDIAKRWIREGHKPLKKPKGYKPGPKLSKMAKKARKRS